MNYDQYQPNNYFFDDNDEEDSSEPVYKTVSQFRKARRKIAFERGQARARLDFVPAALRDTVISTSAHSRCSEEQVWLSMINPIGPLLDRKAAVVPRLHDREYLIFANIWNLADKSNAFDFEVDRVARRLKRKLEQLEQSLSSSEPRSFWFSESAQRKFDDCLKPNKKWTRDRKISFALSERPDEQLIAKLALADHFVVAMLQSRKQDSFKLDGVSRVINPACVERAVMFARRLEDEGRVPRHYRVA